MNNTKETRAFIAAVYENDGSATTSQIRRRTDLTGGQLHHQYRKLEDHGWITVSKQSEAVSSGARMKVATLTEKAIDEIENKAYLSHGQQPERTRVDVAELAEQVEEMTEAIEEIRDYVTGQLYERMKENAERLDTLESSEGSSE